MVLGKTLESSLKSKEVKAVYPKGNQPEYSLEGLMLKLQSQLIGKDLDAGKDRREKEMGATEDKTVGWHHRLNGLEFEQTPGDSEGQESLVCCNPQVTNCHT